MKIQQGNLKRKEWFTMNKKVRIISSSPRRGGNSETLAAVFAGGVNGVGEIAGHPALEQAYQMGKEV